MHESLTCVSGDTSVLQLYLAPTLINLDSLGTRLKCIYVCLISCVPGSVYVQSIIIMIRCQVMYVRGEEELEQLVKVFDTL